MKGQLMKEKTGIEDKATQAPTKPGKKKPSDSPLPGCKNVAIVNTQAGEASAKQPAKNGQAYLLVLGAAVTSGLALSACFFPLAWGALAWVALVPFLLLVRSGVRPAWIYFCAWLAGSVFFWITLSWMPASNHLMRNAWYGVSLYCSLYFPLAIFLIRVLDRRTVLPLIVSAPVVWVTLDFVRSFLLTGFPWYFLGHSQHIFLPMIQIADIGGAYAITFLIVMVNAMLFEWLALRPSLGQFLQHPSRAHQASMTNPSEPDAPAKAQRRRRIQTAIVASLVMLTLVYGFWRLGQNTFDKGPRVALLQGNIDQNVRNQLTAEQQTGNNGQAQKNVEIEYVELLEHAAAFPYPIDLVVWPETSFPGWWPEINRDIPLHKVPLAWEQDYAMSRKYMKKITERISGANMLIGINTFSLDAPKKVDAYNTALFTRADGTIGGRYDKIHRLPFGEYIPFPDWPLARYFSPYERLNYGILAGKELKRFQLKNYTFGVLVCYEDSNPVLGRQYGTSKDAGFAWDPFHRLEDLRRWLDGIEQVEGPPVDFLVNISNDGWYAGTSQHNEHLAIARFRAVEARRSLARAVNMGISAVIDGNGRVLTPQHYEYPKKREDGGYVFYWDIDDDSEKVDNLSVLQWNEFKKRSGVLTSIIPIDRRFSLYALWGDWLVYLCMVVLTAGVVYAIAANIRERLARKIAAQS